MSAKPRVRVKAGTTLVPTGEGRTHDSFINFAAKLGIGAGNLTDASGYQFNFITHQRTGLEAAYRGSWIVGAAVDFIADDMTSAGIALASTMDPKDEAKLLAAMRDLQVWQSLTATLKWARLYGGAIGVMMIDGQDMKTPLRLDTIQEGQFRGVFVMDRWMLNPVYGDLITAFGPDFGLPKFYEVVQTPAAGGTATLGAMPGAKIHHSRCVRFEGVPLPYQQRLVENLWGMSVIERIFDRITAFDSTTTGAAQLVFKAHLRTWKIPELRQLIAAGGPMLEAVTKQVDLVRLYQSIEGITLLDGEDEFEALTYAFSGLDSVLVQFGDQLCGALEMPRTRLFGQSPGGLNSTGESDLRNYYDGIHKRQETTLRNPVTKILDVAARSVLGKPLPEGFTFEFAPLWQLSPTERAEVAESRTRSIVGVFDAGIVERRTALAELRAGAVEDGLWQNISDEDIKDAESDPPIADQIEHEMNPPEPAMPDGKVTPIKKDAAAA